MLLFPIQKQAALLHEKVIDFEKVFPDIIKLAELEKSAGNLAQEIERTRRRASALENIRIPNLGRYDTFYHTSNERTCV